MLQRFRDFMKSEGDETPAEGEQTFTPEQVQAMLDAQKADLEAAAQPPPENQQGEATQGQSATEGTQGTTGTPEPEKPAFDAQKAYQELTARMTAVEARPQGQGTATGTPTAVMPKPGDLEGLEKALQAELGETNDTIPEFKYVNPNAWKPS